MLVFAAAQLYAPAIAKLTGRGGNGPDFKIAQFANAPQGVIEIADFGRELRIVVDLLPRTPATRADIRTRRFSSLR